MTKLKLITLVLLASTTVMTGCSQPTDTPRAPHESAREWTAQITPEDDGVLDQEFNSYNLTAAYELLRKSDTDLVSQILLPLKKFVLNAKFVSVPKYRLTRLNQMINIFNIAFSRRLEAHDQSSAFLDIKKNYISTVFAGCTADLRSDCVNASLFSYEANHTHIMALLAKEFDKDIDALQVKAGSDSECIGSLNEKFANAQEYGARKALNSSCRSLIEDRYRFLAMGMYKRSRYSDSEFTFAYMKYSHMFSILLDYETTRAKAGLPVDDSMSLSYLAQAHGNIFETLIANYQPTNSNDPEVRKFIENFNPWIYSRRQANLFQFGTSKMFSLASDCCLFADSSHNKVSPAVLKAIQESQTRTDDPAGPSFSQMVKQIQEKYKVANDDKAKNRLFEAMGFSAKFIAQISDTQSEFYNEYFFMVDRLYRGDLNSQDIENLLKNTNYSRTAQELPRMITNYIKVVMVYRVFDTNEYMAKALQAQNSSSDMFQYAVQSSFELSNRWFDFQNQVDQLDKLMGSYFQNNLNASGKSGDYQLTYDLIKTVNRNIHYIATFPNMIMMNYFLANKKGTITFQTWFGPVEVDAGTILHIFFDGNWPKLWFHFAKDTVALDRMNLLYSLEYLMSTESINQFVAIDQKNAPDKEAQVSDRSKFFDMIFTKYLGDSNDQMKSFVAELESSTIKHPQYYDLYQTCQAELNESGKTQVRKIQFFDLGFYTYTGLADNGLNPLLKHILTGAATAAEAMTSAIENRKAYVRAMIDVVEGDLLRTGKISKKGQDHPDLQKARDLLQELEQYEDRLVSDVTQNYKYFTDCAITLREIERRRTNRIYDEERARLGQIFDRIKPLLQIKDSAALLQATDAINKDMFKDATFDRVLGTNYVLSKYDLFMRIKGYVENDIFAKPTDKEKAIYASDAQDPVFSRTPYFRPRPIVVDYFEDAVKRNVSNKMYSEGTNGTIVVHGDSDNDREDFIKQGMGYLNGSSTAYVQWLGQSQGDQSLYEMLQTLERLYLMQPVESVKASPGVTAPDLVNTFIRVASTFMMDAYDVEYSKYFASTGRVNKAFLQDKWLDKDGITRLAFFYPLITDVSGLADASMTAAGVFVTSLDYAQKVNSMHSLGFIFAPTQLSTVTNQKPTDQEIANGLTYEVVQSAIAKRWGDRIRNRIQKISDLHKEIRRRSDAVTDATQLSYTLNRPFFREGDYTGAWFDEKRKNLVDEQKMNDHQVLIRTFTQRSGNLFNTDKMGTGQ